MKQLDGEISSRVDRRKPLPCNLSLSAFSSAFPFGKVARKDKYEELSDAEEAVVTTTSFYIRNPA